MMRTLPSRRAARQARGKRSVSSKREPAADAGCRVVKLHQRRQLRMRGAMLLEQFARGPRAAALQVIALPFVVFRLRRGAGERPADLRRAGAAAPGFRREPRAEALLICTELAVE